MERIKLHIKLGGIVAELTRTLDAQRSDNWYAMRRHRVGASEVAVLLGREKWKKIRDMIREKVFDARAPHMINRAGVPPKYNGLPCAWGTLFEDCVRNYCEHVYKTVIHEVGSVVGLPGQSCSVDGLGIVSTEKGPQIALFEYKCPYSRCIVAGQIPDNYLPQVLTGMNTLPYCTVAIFVEVNIKRCAINEPGHTMRYEGGIPKYGKSVHPECPLPNVPYTWGAFVYLAPCDEPLQEDAHGVPELKRLLAHREAIGDISLPIDFGTCSFELFEDMMNAYTERLIVAEPLYQSYADEENYVDVVRPDNIMQMAADVYNSQKKDYPNMQMVGILKWKMIQMNTVIVDPVDGYIDAVYPMIRIVNDTVKACDMMDNDTSRLIALEAAADQIEKMSKEFPY